MRKRVREREIEKEKTNSNQLILVISSFSFTFFFSPFSVLITAQSHCTLMLIHVHKRKLMMKDDRRMEKYSQSIQNNKNNEGIGFIQNKQTKNKNREKWNAWHQVLRLLANAKYKHYAQTNLNQMNEQIEHEKWGQNREWVFHLNAVAVSIFPLHYSRKTLRTFSGKLCFPLQMFQIFFLILSTFLLLFGSYLLSCRVWLRIFKSHYYDTFFLNYYFDLSRKAKGERRFNRYFKLNP